uniref:G protein-activated inward rectifier potassium channel 3 n=1 Tax=Hirudo verbana TaxID=311461 RepID=A0A2S1WM43_9ANNE|nr:putative inward rectifier potassium channel 4 [Hirudo verbana]
MRITHFIKSNTPQISRRKSYIWMENKAAEMFDNCVSSTPVLLNHLQFPSDPPQEQTYVPMVQHIRTFVAGKHKRRLVQKSGDCNVTNCNVTKRKQKYLVDIFTTLVDMKWRYHIGLFAAAFVVTWCLFGLIWFCIAVAHQDHINFNNETWAACVDHVYDYPTALLFSIETQTTIGYGYRVIQSECGFAIFILMLQSCVGLFIQSLITGIIFAKISRPKGRSQTIMFSEKAVICKRDNEYNLLFRVGDMRKSHIIGTSIRAVLVKNRLTSEGESIPLCQFPLQLETEMSQADSFVFLIWPVTVVHRINEKSPLWGLSLEGLLKEHFEIIVLLEGTIESTGMSTQVRTSYIPIEIMWGERLVPLLTFQLENGRYEIDYKQFHNTTPMQMPDCSARDYAERLKQGIKENPDKEKDLEYLACFTAPAIRDRGHTFTSMSLHNLFHKKKIDKHGLSAHNNEAHKKTSKKSFAKKKNFSESEFSAPKKQFMFRSSENIANMVTEKEMSEQQDGINRKVLFLSCDDVFQQENGGDTFIDLEELSEKGMS